MRKVSLNQMAFLLATLCLWCSTGLAEQSAPWDEDVNAPSTQQATPSTTPESIIAPLKKNSPGSITNQSVSNPAANSPAVTAPFTVTVSPTKSTSSSVTTSNQPTVTAPSTVTVSQPAVTPSSVTASNQPVVNSSSSNNQSALTTSSSANAVPSQIIPASTNASTNTSTQPTHNSSTPITATKPINQIPAATASNNSNITLQSPPASAPTSSDQSSNLNSAKTTNSSASAVSATPPANVNPVEPSTSSNTPPDIKPVAFSASTTIPRSSKSTEASSSTAIPSAIQTELNRKVSLYASHFAAWRNASKPKSMEPLLYEGQALADQILKAVDASIQQAKDAPQATGILNRDAFNALASQMPGYLLIWHKVIVVAPDPSYWLKEAKQHGLPTDIAFFEAMNQTLNGYWPVTMEQITDSRGCTRFGQDDLVHLYGIWRTFVQEHPHSYLKTLLDPNIPLLLDIEDQLLHSQAACDGPDSVIQELQLFISAYPTDLITPKVKQKLAELQKKPSSMTYSQGVNAHNANANTPQ